MTNKLCLKDAIITMMDNEKALISFSMKYADIYKNDAKAKKVFLNTVEFENKHSSHFKKFLDGLNKDQCSYVIDMDSHSLLRIDPEVVGGYQKNELSVAEAIRTVEICEEKFVDAITGLKRVFGNDLKLDRLLEDEKTLLGEIFSYTQIGDGFKDLYLESEGP